MLSSTGSKLRFGLAVLTGSVVTISYYCFSRSVHNYRRHFPSPHDFRNGTDDHNHGGGNPFEGIYLKYDGFFLYGLALPLLLLTLASLLWNPSPITEATVGSSRRRDDGRFSRINRCLQGDPNVQKWTLLAFVLPLLYVFYDASHAFGSMTKRHQENNPEMHWNWWNTFLMSMMSPTGYAATWALAAFLIPVTKHSPILDWFRVTPVQALAFHRVSGWTSLFMSILHGILHLRHLMEVLFMKHHEFPGQHFYPPSTPWYKKLWILIVPPSWECIADQDPLAVFVPGYKYPPEVEDRRCWLALVNATGTISTVAFVILGITSLPQVRRASYALFYTVHIPAAWIMLIMAIWHYPTCALVLIPNILYYLSFNIPAMVLSSTGGVLDVLKKETQGHSPLLESNWIRGGTVELVFAADPKDCPRHESRFVRLSHLGLSIVSHPFSIFSGYDLKKGDNGTSGTTESHGPSSFSILFRPMGPFTKGLAKALFPNHPAGPDTLHVGTISEEHEDNNDLEGLLQNSAHPSDSHHINEARNIQIESFFASSFDWIDNAMLSHDEILLLAGGVGIVPFLSFLPSLHQRICADSAAATVTTMGDDDVGDSEALVDPLGRQCQVGPSCIHLHWYCREVGLASYIWYKYLCYQVQQVWESNPSTRGRLIIHMHLTSLSGAAGASARGEEILTSGFPNLGLVEKLTYCSIHEDQEESSQATHHVVKDSSPSRSVRLGLLLPGSIFLFGTIIHWWWYKEFIIHEKYREDILSIRSHSVFFTLLLALVVSILVPIFLRCHAKSEHNQAADRSTNEEERTIGARSSTTGRMSAENQSNTTGFLNVLRGRTPMENVVSDILQAKQPGLYMCGPQKLMSLAEVSILGKCPNCAIYREDSNM